GVNGSSKPGTSQFNSFPPAMLDRDTGNLLHQVHRQFAPVKVEDPRRSREMKQFGIALCCLFLLVMTYAWQHFKAIEYGYKIETLRTQRDGLVEMNRALRLEEASLRDPERIDMLARRLGLQSPQAGQVIRIHTDNDAGVPELASVASVSLIAVR